MKIKTNVNGKSHAHDVEPRTLLAHYLRENLSLTGTHIGCDTSSCGSCTVHMDGGSA
ncbi:(2Fe-2S)-binding protein [Persicitalea sp.]|uniref:(2Fe-2S)-binding protein n=1 Tax=Persicitalea sp. TaxID=3100273 RepID=UPI003593E3B2